MKFQKWVYLIIIGFIFSLNLTACSKTPTVAPGLYDSSEVGKVKKVVPGVLISSRPVRLRTKAVEQKTDQAGSADSNPLDAPAVAESRGVEYVVRLDTGAIISVVQVDGLGLQAKQRVLVIYGDDTRVVADQDSGDN